MRKKLRDWGDILDEISDTEPLLWSWAVQGLATTPTNDLRDVLSSVPGALGESIEEDIISALMSGFPCLSSEDQIAIRRRPHAWYA